jgi:hypothetical protein
VSFILIDEAGEVHPAEQRGAFEPRDDPINESGFIRIDYRGQRCRICLQASVVSAAALIGLLHWLRDSRVKTVLLFDLSKQNSVPSIASRSRALQLVRNLLAEATPGPGDSRRRLSRRLRAEHSILSPFVAPFLEVARNRNGIREMVPACEAMFRGRYTITHVHDGSQTVLIAASGEGYKSLARSWCHMAPGHRLQDGPDYHYGRWVAEAHRSAFSAGWPAFHDVDALISRPRQSPMRVTYTRLIAPFVLRGGKRYILSASAVRDSIDLRSAGANET